MGETRAGDSQQFRRILTRNLAVPLAMGVVSVGVFAGLLLYVLNTIGWVDHTHRVIARANELAALSAEQEGSMRGFLLTGEERFLVPYTLGRAKLDAELEAAQTLVSDNPAQVERVRRIIALVDRWDAFAQQVIALRRAKQPYEHIILAEVGKNLRDEIRRELREMTEVEQLLLTQRTDAAERAAWVGGGIYVALLLLVSGALALSGRRDILGLSREYGDALARVQAGMRESEERSWLRGAQLDLSQRLVGDLSLSAIGEGTLDFLSQRIGVVVAAAYVRGEDGRPQRVATRGLAHGAEVADAEAGLVGQAWRDGRVMRLPDLDAGFLKVATSLGDKRPAEVLLLPAVHEGLVNGVFELGFLQPLNERGQALLETLQASLGAILAAAHYRARLQAVLEETRQLNEELQVQQEELRTANEELGEQSRVLGESQTNLEHQRAELEQTNLQLAEQAETLARRNAALNQAQAELKERALELQRASRYKSEFLANMSHELRTPLNSSLILAKLLSENKGGNLTDEQLKFVRTIHSAGQDLLNLINDILDLSKVEAGKLDITPQPIELRHLADTLQRVFSPLAQEKRLRFEVQLAPGLPPRMVSDNQRLEQILKNLLSNAIKFTEQGQVTLALEPRGDDRIAFVVQDTGIGIAPDQQQLVFEAFHQGDGALNRRHGGTGLGLSISRELATLLGGDIQLHSAPGEGSRFTLTLPLQHQGPAAARGEPAAQPAAPAAAPTWQPSATIAAPATPAPPSPAFDDDRRELQGGARTGRWALVVEDDASFAAILYDLAHEMNYRCMVTGSAREALELAIAHQPQAILLDVRLPDDSGLTVLQRLKGDPRTRHIPVHVISGEDFRDVALPMGAVGLAVKPTTRQELIDIFRKLEQRGAERVRRLLLVEDDARQRESIVHLIGDDDIEVTAVDRGEAALQALATQHFDCMITDLKLPDMDGSELLARMAARHGEPQPPVIVYTGRQLSRQEEAELSRYSRSIIIKGARSPERLLDEVTLFLHKVESQLSGERQAMLRSARNREEVFEGRKVLLVDDDMRNIFALTSALEQRGLVVEAARNGVEAIEKLNTQSDIDVVLMDVMMPVMDGLEATRRLRADPRFQKLPIIAITAKAMRDDQEQCRRAGANDYLAKPIELDRLVSLLRVWLPGVQGL